MTNWQTLLTRHEDEEEEDEEDKEPETNEDEEGEEDEFPQKLYVRMDSDANEGGGKAFPVAGATLEEVVGRESEPVAIAEYELTKSYKARLKVEVLEED